jgi:hypothetical protein
VRAQSASIAPRSASPFRDLLRKRTEITHDKGISPQNSTDKDSYDSNDDQLSYEKKGYDSSTSISSVKTFQGDQSPASISLNDRNYSQNLDQQNQDPYNPLHYKGRDRLVLQAPTSQTQRPGHSPNKRPHQNNQTQNEFYPASTNKILIKPQNTHENSTSNSGKKETDSICSETWSDLFEISQVRFSYIYMYIYTYIHVCMYVHFID